MNEILKDMEKLLTGLNQTLYKDNYKYARANNVTTAKKQLTLNLIPQTTQQKMNKR